MDSSIFGGNEIISNKGMIVVGPQIGLEKCFKCMNWFKFPILHETATKKPRHPYKISHNLEISP